MKDNMKNNKEQYFLMKFWHITFQKWSWKFGTETFEKFVKMKTIFFFKSKKYTKCWLMIHYFVQF